jgi:hypothetical protein
MMRAVVRGIALVSFTLGQAHSASPGHGATNGVEESSSVAADDLERLRKSGDLRLQRGHVWELMARLTQQVGEREPLFETWYGESLVFSKTSFSGSPGIRGFLRESSTGAASSQHGDAPQASDVPVVTYTLYNYAAYQHIRSHHLYLVSELDRLRITAAEDPVVIGDLAVPPFPAEAIVLKTVWWPVARTGLTAMPVWDPEHNPPRRGGNDYTGWQRIVAIDPNPDAQATSSVRMEFVSRAFADVHRVDLKALYHVIVDQRMADHMMRDDTTRRATWIALGRSLEAGDYLALVGANMAAREISDWVWASFWWHDRPNEGPFAAGRPDQLKGEWRNYLLQVAFDADRPAAHDGGPHICFNPWLEGRFPDGGHGAGAQSNCMACHRRASYPAVNFLPVTRGAPDLTQDPAYAAGRLRTSFLWSIAMHARP